MAVTKKNILVVEDSPIVLKILSHILKNELDERHFAIDYAESLAQAKQLLDSDKEYFAALADLNLPDAPDGEVVELILDRSIPCIVLTGTYSEERRDKLLMMGIVDYVVKESRFSYGYAVKLINRLVLNESIKVLLVEDSETSRKYIRGLLKHHLFQVLEAENGVEGLKIYEQNPDIRLIITDYFMPEMDGFELVREIRSRSDKSDLAIIGLSSADKSSLSAKFIKNGANDFLQKPFFAEELHCRVIHNLESIELMQALHDAAHRDYLTGLYNRRYLFDVGEDQYAKALQGNAPLAVALMDIDHFKAINDNYGHEGGDAVLVDTGSLLNEAFERFVVARMGGEEFCVIMPGLSQQQAYTLMDGFRARFENEGVDIGGGTYIESTISIGVTSIKGESLDQMIAAADELLYRAKEVGRNFVIGDD